MHAAALTGYLRADGLETTKKNAVLLNNHKVYKVLLLDLKRCRGCEYISCLQQFEDIAFIQAVAL